LAYRATQEQVEAILQDDYESGDNLLPYMETANGVVADLATADTDSVLSSTILGLIERWLGAHYYTVQNHQLTQEASEKASGVYAGEYGKGLASSKYGQTAMELDRTGFLSKMNKGNVTAKLTWLGKPPSGQTAYSDRD